MPSIEEVLAAFRSVTGWPDELVLHYADEQIACSCMPIRAGEDCAQAEEIWRRSGQ